MGYSYEPKRTAPPIQPPKPKMQTLHVYLDEEEEEQTPPPPPPNDWGTRFMGVLAVAMLAIFILAPYQPVYAVSFLSVPAIFLPPRVFTVTEQMTPTGTQTTPATTAHGVLTFFNGSLFSQGVPQNFQLMTSGGVTVATRPGSYYSGRESTQTTAKCPLRLMRLIQGRAAIFQPELSIRTMGRYILIKNLTAFTGGTDAVITKVITSDDVQAALTTARVMLTSQRPTMMLAKPCAETQNQQQSTLTVSWSCTYATYTAPRGAQVLSAFVEGNSVILEVKMLVRNSGG